MSTRIRLSLIGLAVCLALATVWIGLAVPGTALAKKPGGGGNNPPEVTGCAVFREDFSDYPGLDAVLGEGPDWPVLYCEAEITSFENRDEFSVHPYRKGDLWLDFSDFAGAPEDVNEPPFPGLGLVEFGEFTQSRFDPRTLVDMNPGEALQDVWMFLKFRNPASKKSYLIYFRGPLWGAIPGTDGITVTANGEEGGPVDSWTFESPGVGALVLGEKGGQTFKGLFDLPFSLTFTADP